MSKLRAFTMPKWGIEMTEGVVTEWALAEGEAFSKGQIIASVETDKIVNDIEAEYDGVCLRQLAGAGESHPVGALLGVMGPADVPVDEVDVFVAGFVPAEAPDALEAENDAAAADNPSPSAATAADYVSNTDLPVSPAASAAAAAGAADLSQLDQGSGQGGRVLKQDVEQLLRGGGILAAGDPVDISVIPFVDLGETQAPYATPIARQFAASRGIALQSVSGSGKNGRIRLRDIQPHGSDTTEPGPPQQAESEWEPFTPVRARIARRLTAAARDIPHFYVETEVRADKLLKLRISLNHGSSKVSVNDLIVKAVAESLMAHPDINVNVSNDGVKRFKQANVAVAVARDDGLVAPVLSSADTKSLSEIAGESQRLIAGARGNTLQHEDYSGGSFTVSNLGMFGVTRFTAIINPPQGAILSVGAALRRPVEVEQGIGFGNFMTLMLGCDHRAIDGAQGAAFLADLKARLEQPDTLAG